MKMSYPSLQRGLNLGSHIYHARAALGSRITQKAATMQAQAARPDHQATLRFDVTNFFLSNFAVPHRFSRLKPEVQVLAFPATLTAGAIILWPAEKLFLMSIAGDCASLYQSNFLTSRKNMRYAFGVSAVLFGLGVLFGHGVLPALSQKDPFYADLEQKYALKAPSSDWQEFVRYGCLGKVEPWALAKAAKAEGDGKIAQYHGYQTMATVYGALMQVGRLPLHLGMLMAQCTASLVFCFIAMMNVCGRFLEDIDTGVPRVRPQHHVIMGGTEAEFLHQSELMGFLERGSHSPKLLEEMMLGLQSSPKMVELLHKNADKIPELARLRQSLNDIAFPNADLQGIVSAHTGFSASPGLRKLVKTMLLRLHDDRLDRLGALQPEAKAFANELARTLTALTEVLPSQA